VAAEPNKNSPQGNDDRAKMMRVLVPSVAIAVVVILVAVLAAVYEQPPAGEKDKGGKGKGGYPPPTGGTDVTKLSDGSSPTAEDPGLQPLGATGIKYRDLKTGDGPEVKPGQRVWSYYTGWLTDGTIFDSSRRRGEAIDFSLNQVIQGWSKGIPGMKVGGIRKLYIPSELAYGPVGNSGIPPNSPLIFEVEIVDAR
jgi:hypothetical protein